MPASMISADTGGNAYVAGSSIAMVATGPMPGSTPIRVPSTQPMKQYSRLIGVTATPKPVARVARRSMSFFLSAADEGQTDDGGDQAHRGQADRGQAADEDAEQQVGRDDEAERLPRPFADRLAV